MLAVGISKKRCYLGCLLCLLQVTLVVFFVSIFCRFSAMSVCSLKNGFKQSSFIMVSAIKIVRTANGTVGFGRNYISVSL